MVNLDVDWRFKEAKLDFDFERIARLLTPITTDNLLNLIEKQIETVSFQWKKGDMEAKGHHRAEFRFQCSAEVCDVFHSGISGMRAHYYLGITQGERLTRYLIDGLADKLISSSSDFIRATGVSSDKVQASLSGPTAKIWMDEDVSNLDKKRVDAEALIAIEVPHWVNAAKKASAAFSNGAFPFPKCKEKALLGVQVPICTGIGIFGVWLNDQNDAHFLASSKRNRARHIRAYGFS